MASRFARARARLAALEHVLDGGDGSSSSSACANAASCERAPPLYPCVFATTPARQLAAITAVVNTVALATLVAALWRHDADGIVPSLDTPVLLPLALLYAPLALLTGDGALSQACTLVSFIVSFFGVVASFAFATSLSSEHDGALSFHRATVANVDADDAATTHTSVGVALVCVSIAALGSLTACHAQRAPETAGF